VRLPKVGTWRLRHPSPAHSPMRFLSDSCLAVRGERASTALGGDAVSLWTGVREGDAPLS